MIVSTPEFELSVPSLTKSEIRWIEGLQKILSACPKRLELVTTGDSSLSIVDAEGAKKSELADGAGHTAGVILAYISGGPTVHGVSG